MSSLPEQLYVASNLENFVLDGPGAAAWPAALYVALAASNEPCAFARLTPAVYGWLCRQLERLRNRASAAPEQLALAASRFAVVREWVEAHWGPAEFEEAAAHPAASFPRPPLAASEVQHLLARAGEPVPAAPTQAPAPKPRAAGGSAVWDRGTRRWHTSGSKYIPLGK